MTRTVYRCVLLLHPQSFRRQFAGEMLWIFEQAAATEGAGLLLLDALVSLARQWLLRYGTWKIAASAIGALLYLTLAFAMTRPF